MRTLDDAEVQTVAERYGVSPQQVCRWLFVYWKHRDTIEKRRGEQVRD